MVLGPFANNQLIWTMLLELTVTVDGKQLVSEM
jgi:hypothetical protein